MEVAVVMVFIKQEKIDSEHNRQCMREGDYSPAKCLEQIINGIGTLFEDCWDLS